jgi:DNA mismatch endonuclease (patch repair protein)
MRAVRAKDTSPEIRVRRAARKLKLAFSLHGDLPGRPDLVVPGAKIAIFVNGCFWHGHPGCRRAAFPKTNKAFWKEKLSKNKKRDSRNYRLLRRLGWSVLILWECQIGTPELAEAALRLRLNRARR